MSEGVDTVDESQDDATHADRDSQQPQTVGQVKKKQCCGSESASAFLLVDWIRIRIGPIRTQEDKNYL